MRRRVYDKIEDQEPYEISLRGIINTIMRGFAREGATMSTCKRYLRAIQGANVVSTLPRRTILPSFLETTRLILYM